MKLQIKVPLLLILMVLVIGAISGITTNYFHRKNSIAQFEQTATAMAKTVQGSLEQGMMLGETQYLQEALSRISDEEIVSEVILFTPNGYIAASNQLLMVGKLGAHDEVYNTLSSGESQIWTEERGNSGAFLISTPVLNKQECQQCHSPADAILGAIQVGFDTTILDTQTRQETALVVLMGLFSFIVAGGGIAFALKRMALNPISRLAGSAQRLSQGDYSARAITGNNDEIGTLAKTFNEMAENIEQRTRDLEASHQQLAEWNAGLEDTVQQRTRELLAINTIITAVNQSLNLERLLNDTLDTIIRELDIEAGMVHLLSPGEDQFTLAVQQGMSPDYEREVARLKVGTKSQSAKAGKRKRTVNVMRYFKIDPPRGENGVFNSHISLPLLLKKRVLGVLSLASAIADRFEPESVRLLYASAEALAIAIDNARTTQNLQEARTLGERLMEKLITAQEEERRRIARELHDDASQSLAALAMNLEDIADSLPEEYNDTRDKLATLKKRAVETLGGIRNLALELRPSALDDLGLEMAIDWYAKDYLGKRGLDTEIKVVGPQTKLPSYTETMLFRIIQEALTNVAKHAEATRVRVQLQLGESIASIRVEDNGKGFNVDEALSKESMRRNLGIHGMAERATLMGGTFTIRSEPGKGTTLFVEVPVTRGNGNNE